MSDERPDGFYWAKLLDGEWTILLSQKSRWWTASEDWEYHNDAVTEIGPYIGTEPQDTGWRDIASAPKDGTLILAHFRADLVKFTGRDDLDRWADKTAVLHHPGLASDGFDIGWGVNAPVGHGGLPDAWIDGWMPLPAAPREQP